MTLGPVRGAGGRIFTARSHTVRSFARHSGPLPAVDPLLSAVYTISTELSSAFTTTTLMRVAVQRLQQKRPNLTELHPFAPAKFIPTRSLTLGARVLHTSTSVFDRSQDPVPTPSYSLAVASHALSISPATAIHDIGHDLTHYSAWAHYERAPADKTEHITNSFRHRGRRRATSQYVIPLF
ncbi:hypothetical protein Ptr902_10644 [Pyrenophora tritici-repentis]|nr:hypothetical protein Ptr902_10644 [Pyrenophora tritici-repentis]